MNTTQYVEYIKKRIENLYQTNPNIHISVNQPHQKEKVVEKSAKLVGVYKNIFQVEEYDGKKRTRHSFQYGDILIGQVKIKELNCPPIIHTTAKKQ